MVVKKSRKVFVFLATLALLFYSTTVFLVPSQAKADDLIIEDSGAVILVITNNSVLAETTDKKESAKPAATPGAAPQIVPVAPANSESKVKISPNTTSDKKIRITIETTTPKAANQAAFSTIPAPKVTPTTIEKTVDNVILRGADKQPVLSIKPNQNQNNEVNIQQQNINVSTNLPIQIDTKSHVISVQTTSGTQQVSVLPDQAVKGAQQKIVNQNLETVKSDVSLNQENGQTVYTVNQERKGKFLGAFDITLPSSVRISAQTGKTISVWQSPVSLLFGFLIR